MTNNEKKSLKSILLLGLFLLLVILWAGFAFLGKIGFQVGISSVLDLQNYLSQLFYSQIDTQFLSSYYWFHFFERFQVFLILFLFMVAAPFMYLVNLVFLKWPQFFGDSYEKAFYRDRWIVSFIKKVWILLVVIFVMVVYSAGNGIQVSQSGLQKNKYFGIKKTKLNWNQILEVKLSVTKHWKGHSELIVFHLFVQTQDDVFDLAEYMPYTNLLNDEFDFKKAEFFKTIFNEKNVPLAYSSISNHIQKQLMKKVSSEKLQRVNQLLKP